MSTIFISDLHLDESQPEIIQIFLHFLKTQAKQADALYILGDLFEVWIGDDDNTPLQKQVGAALHQLSEQVPIYFMAGNRDFLVGKRYLEFSGMKPLTEPCLIDLYGKKALLTHGDLLCTKDRAYQRLRQIIRSPKIQQGFLWLPIFARRKIAHLMRKKSHAATQRKDLYIMDVDQEAVKQMISNHGVDLLIHGHTHRPAIHWESWGTRIVLGAWHERGHMLVYEPNHEKQLIQL